MAERVLTRHQRRVLRIMFEQRTATICGLHREHGFPIASAHRVLMRLRRLGLAFVLGRGGRRAGQRGPCATHNAITDAGVRALFPETEG